MPTQKRRLLVTLGDDLHSLLHRLSDVSGQSMSSIIVEMLETSRPVFEALITAAENYRHLDESKRADLLAALEESERRIMPDAQRVQRETLDAFEGKPTE